MHILYIHQHFATPADFLGTRSYELAQRLIDAGHTVTMLCGDTARSNADDSNKKERVIRYETDRINVIKVLEPYANSMGFTARVISFLKFAITATKLARGVNADLVFATSTPLTVGIPGVFAAKKRNVPFVFEVRDLWPELPISMGAIKNPVVIWMLRSLERFLYKRSHAIVALAPGIRDGIKVHTKDHTPLAMIPNASDNSLFKPTPHRCEDNRFGEPTDFKVVYCGHHGVANGLNAALDAAAVLKEQGVIGIRFVMIGTGSEKSELIKRCNAEQLQDYFSWIGSIPKQELATLLPGMDVGFMPLMNVKAFQYGTSPNKFFDYLASGIPILNNYPGWVGELLEAHQCGVSVPPDDSVALAEALIKLRDNDSQRELMGVSARKLAETRFSRDLLGREFVEFIEQAHLSYA